MSSLVLAAASFPWIYSGGMMLADAAATQELPAILESIGESAGRAKIGRFFNRALLLCALCTLPFLIKRIRSIRHADTTQHSPAPPKLSLTQKLTQLGISFTIAAGILWIMSILLVQAGAFTLDPNSPSFSKVISKAVMPAIGAAVVEEWVFRGLLLGLWLRFCKPVTACISCSLFFAFLHFLNPPVTINHPEHLLAGFEVLGKILYNFADPRFFVADFATLTVVGLILAWAKIKTGRLWFCFGLHAGWVFAFKLFSLFYDQALNHSLNPWGVGQSLRSGAIPLIGLLITGLACHFVLKKLPIVGAEEETEEPSDTDIAPA